MCSHAPTASKHTREQRLAELRAVTPVCVACLVKQFLRELPDPLLTRPLSPLFVAAGRTEDERERNANLRLLLRGLPALNRRVLRELVAFLQLVAAHSAHNKMTAENLGIVFAPTLLYTDLAAPDTSALADAGVANDVVATLITHYADLLPDDPLPLTPPRTPVRTSPTAAPTTPTAPTAPAPVAPAPPEPHRKKSRPSGVPDDGSNDGGGDDGGDGAKEETSNSKEGKKDDDDDDESGKDHDEEGEENVEDEDEEEEDEEEEEEEKNVPTKEMLEAYLTAIREWEAKKERVKDDLVAYDAAFAREHGGRMPTAQEKEPMRERYAQYHSIKSAIETLRAEYERGLAQYRATAAGAADILPHPYAGLSAAELSRALVRLATEKRNLRCVLSRWSHEFAARHHRPPTDAIDYAPVQDEFTRYCRNKETAAMIRRYLEAHGHHPATQ